MKQKRNSFFKFPMLTALATAVVILALSLTAGVGNHTVMATLDTGNPVQDELNIKTGTLVSNVFAFGESLSGLTVEEAVAKINRATSTVLTKRLHAISADADKEWTATFQDLGIHLTPQGCSVWREFLRAMVGIAVAGNDDDTPSIKREKPESKTEDYEDSDVDYDSDYESEYEDTDDTDDTYYEDDQTDSDDDYSENGDSDNYDENEYYDYDEYDY